MLRINPFVYTFRQDKKIALFNALTLATLYLSEKQYKSLMKSPPKPLIEAKFFVKENFNAQQYLQNFTKKSLNKNEIRVAYFLLTSACNLGCKYCFIESRFGQKNNNSYMSEDMAEKAVKLLFRNAKKVTIIFYGGEPLLNFKAIKRTVLTAKKLGLESRFQLITNGYLINNEIAAFIKKHHINLAISLDGTKKINDAMRKDLRGRGTYDKAMAAMELLSKKKVPFSISCTIANHNIDCPDNILKVMEKYDVKTLGYNLVTPNQSVKISKATRQKMVENILKTENLLIEKGIFEDRIISRKLKPFIEGKNWIKDCAGYGNQITVTPEGSVGPCHGLWPDFVNKQVKNTYFDIDVNYKGKIKEHPTWTEWSMRTPLNMPQCWDCYGIGLCGGGCAKNSVIKKGSIWEIDEEHCVLVKEAIPWVIWKYRELKLSKQKQG